MDIGLALKRSGPPLPASSWASFLQKAQKKHIAQQALGKITYQRKNTDLPKPIFVYDCARIQSF